MTTKKSRSKSGKSKQTRYPVELKLKAVKLFIEEGYATEMVATELGIGKSTLGNWVKRYRENGVAGLEPRPPVHKNRPKVDRSVKAKAVELKQVRDPPAAGDGRP